MTGSSGGSGALLLSDATLPVNFCLAGLPAARAMAAHLGDRVHMVDEVHAELHKVAADKKLVALETLLKEWPPHAIIMLDAALREKVSDAVLLRGLGQHPKEDRGEAATVLYAEQRLETGTRFDVLTDDSWGKDLARDRQLRCVTTQMLVVEMVSVEALSFQDGQRVWSESFNRKPDKLKLYRDAIKRDCPHRLPAPKPKKGKGK